MTGRPFKKKLLLIAVLAIFAILIVQVLKPRPLPPEAPLPNPNGYEDFQRAISVRTGEVPDIQNATLEELRSSVERNQEALKFMRAGLSRECRIPVEYSQAYVARLLPELDDSGRPAPGSDNGPGARTRFYVACANLLQASLSGEGVPGVAIFDDLHWSDDATLEFLGWLTHRLDGRPIMLLATWRGEELSSGHVLQRMLGSAEREGRAELAGEVVHAEVGAVGAQLLGGHGQLDRLEQRVRRRAHLRLGRRRPMPERQEPDFLHPYILPFESHRRVMRLLPSLLTCHSCSSRLRL
jgi:hypothetical protein